MQVISDPSCELEDWIYSMLHFRLFSEKNNVYMYIGFRDAQYSTREGETLQMYPLTFFF